MYIRVSEPSIFRRLPAPRLPAPKAQNIVNKGPNFLVMYPDVYELINIANSSRKLNCVSLISRYHAFSSYKLFLKILSKAHRNIDFNHEF